MKIMKFVTHDAVLFLFSNPSISVDYGTLTYSYCFRFYIISEPAPAQAFSSSKTSKVPSFHNHQEPVLYVAPSTSSRSMTEHQTRAPSPQEDLPPPPPPPHVLQYQCNDYQNIHLRPLPKPFTKPLRSQRIAKV